MRLHPNAKTTPRSRRLVADRVLVEGQSVHQVARDLGISRRTVYKWLSRFRQEGGTGLSDRSSRPRHSPRGTARFKVRRIEQLRHKGLTAWEIAPRVGVAPSTVSRIIKRQGLGRLWRVEEARKPPRRYEHATPGSMVHIDAKKLAKIDGVGHRIHGDRARRKRGVGWEVAFVAVDDMSRLAYAEVLPGETGEHARAFLRRATRWFESLGVEVKRILTDNAKAYTSNVFRELCREKNISQSFTRPYTPRTNGKAERFIQTLSRKWAYGKSYRSSGAREDALRSWIKSYNHNRPHRGIGMKTPIVRLRESREQRP